MNSRFDLVDTSLCGLIVIQRKTIGDRRGYLERLFCEEELRMLIPGKGIAQINRTLTEKCGTVRGMHFQHPPHAETKFVTCLRGEVYDVAVDLRQGSPTFLHWYAEFLSSENHKSFVIPEGFAHGFQTLTDECEMLYFHTAAYRPDAECALHPQDTRLAIRWPLPVSGLSPRDAAHPWLTDEFVGVRV